MIRFVYKYLTSSTVPEHRDHEFVWKNVCAHPSAHTKFGRQCSGISSVVPVQQTLVLGMALLLPKYPYDNVFDGVTEHTRDIEHYLQSEKNDDNSTTQLCDRSNVTFKESGEGAE